MKILAWPLLLFVGTACGQTMPPLRAGEKLRVHHLIRGTSIKVHSRGKPEPDRNRFRELRASTLMVRRRGRTESIPLGEITAVDVLIADTIPPCTGLGVVIGGLGGAVVTGLAGRGLREDDWFGDVYFFTAVAGGLVGGALIGGLFGYFQGERTWAPVALPSPHQSAPPAFGGPPRFGVLFEALRSWQAEKLGIAGGLRVAWVNSGGPAELAGVQVDDVIVTIDGQPMTSGAELRSVLAVEPPPEAVEVGVLRDDQILTLTASLEEISPAPEPGDPDEPPRSPTIHHRPRQTPLLHPKSMSHHQQTSHPRSMSHRPLLWKGMSPSLRGSTSMSGSALPSRALATLPAAQETAS